MVLAATFGAVDALLGDGVRCGMLAPVESITTIDKGGKNVGDLCEYVAERIDE